MSATLTGGTVAITTLAGAYNPSTQYTILSTTTGVTGNFSGVTVSGYNPQLFASSLSYDGFSVFLTLNYNNAAFLSLAQTQNQKAVAGALSAFGPTCLSSPPSQARATHSSVTIWTSFRVKPRPAPSTAPSSSQASSSA
ncbi:hypothetical protein ACQ5SK_30735 [Bradyrhizobium japonicum]